MPAAVNPVCVREVYDRLLAVKKNKLDLFSQLWLLRQDARHFQKHSGARATVVRADKTKSIEDFCVVVRAKKKQPARLRAASKARDQVHEFYVAVRRWIDKRRFRDLPAAGFELFFNISTRPDDGVRTRWSRTEIDQALHVRECLLARKILPDFFRRSFGARSPKKKEDKKTRSSQRQGHEVLSASARIQTDDAQDPLKVIIAVIFYLDSAALRAVMNGNVRAEMLSEFVL